MSDIRLIVTDLDGTLMGNASEFPLYAEFRDMIGDLRRRDNVVWVICTGRTLTSFREYFAPMRLMEIQPDYIVIRHAYIFGVTRLLYTPHIFWNFRIFYRIWNSESYIRDKIDDWYDMIRCFPSGITAVFKGRHRLWLRFESEEKAGKIASTLTERAKGIRYLQIFQRKQELDIRAVPFTKGLAVSELAAHLGIARDNILTIGDGHNDISMLDGKVAAKTGCPANARPEVIQTVHESGGHIASAGGLKGVMEILDAYLRGTVRSALPPGWVVPSELAGREMKKPDSSGRSRKRLTFAKIVLIMAVVYVVLLVFASFRLLPFHRVITKPYTYVIERVERCVRFFSR